MEWDRSVYYGPILNLRRDIIRMDEQIKQPLLIGILVANIVFVGYQILFNLSPFSFPSAMIGLLISAAVGGGVFAAMYFMGRD